MKKLIPLIFLFIVSSCVAATEAISPSLPSSNNFINRFPANKKGVAIIQLNSSYGYVTWCKTDLISEQKYENCQKITPSSNYQIFMLEPGWYEISAYEVVSSSITRLRLREQKVEPDFSNITHKRRSKPIISFKISEGKISYVGQIKFHDQATLGTHINDEYTVIENAFKEKNSDKLLKLFKSYKIEAEFLFADYKKDPALLTKSLAKTKTDFNEEKKLQKQKEKVEKKKLKEEMKLLKKKD